MFFGSRMLPWIEVVHMEKNQPKRFSEGACLQQPLLLRDSHMTNIKLMVLISKDCGDHVHMCLIFIACGGMAE